MAIDTEEYRKLSDELNQILDKIQERDIEVDEAIKLYERGTDITKQLEDFLKNAENKITSLEKSSRPLDD